MKYKLIYASLFSIYFSQVHAEAVFDGTVGEKGQLSGHFEIPAEKGQQEGNNLFHSFEKFNILQGESATFSGPDSIQYVINRVTGDNASTINGLLRSTFPNADIYLINPAGVMFGEEARLDIQGNLQVSTADVLRLKDGGEFHASNPQKSILSSAPPSAFGFLTESPAAISLKNSKLELADGKTLSLIGGKISIQDSVLVNSGMTVVGVNSSGQVSMKGDSQNIHPADVEIKHSDISMEGDTTQGIYIRGGQFLMDDSSLRADVSNGNSGGYIIIEADDVSILGEHGKARILSGTFGQGKGGNVSILAKGKISLAKNSNIFVDSACPPSGCSVDRVGDAGNVVLKANQVFLLEGAQLITTTAQAGAGGNIEITADNIQFSGGESGILSSTFGDGNAGAAGHVHLQAKNFTMEGGSYIVGDTKGEGQGGNIHIEVADSMKLTESSLISADTEYSGNAGEIFVESKNLAVLSGSTIASGTFGMGDGGLVTLKIADTTEISGRTVDNYPSGIFAESSADSYPSGIFAESSTESLGNAGIIMIETDHLIVSDGAVVDSSTFGEGSGGGMVIIARDSVKISNMGSALIASSEWKSGSNLGGAAGRIDLKTNNLVVQGGGQIATSTFSGGHAGNVNISANRIQLHQEKAISSASYGLGNAGNIILDVGDSIHLQNATMTTESELAEGGSITIQAKELVDLEKSKITTSVKGESGDGGNIRIFQPNFVVLGSSEIIARAVGGNGGNINIVAKNFVQTPDSAVDASSERGIDGEVTIESPDTETTGAVVILPTTFLNVSTMIKESCAAAAARGQSNSFVVVGRSGLPISAEAFQPSSMPRNAHLKTSAQFPNSMRENFAGQLPILLVGCNGKL